MASPPKTPRKSSDGRVEVSLDSLHLLNALRSGDRTYLESHLSPRTLLLACQVSELSTVQYLLSKLDVNARDQMGNTALHAACQSGRVELIRLLGERDADDNLPNMNGKLAIDLAKTPEVTAEVQKYRSSYIEKANTQYIDLLTSRNASELDTFLMSPRIKSVVDLDAPLPLHLAVQFGDAELAKVLVAAGADVFARNKQGKTAIELAHSTMKDILKKGSIEGIKGGNLDGTSMSGYLKKWTNYGGGWKLRWVQLDNHVLSYYKSRDDLGRTCRGSINMRVASIEKVSHRHDKERFEFKVIGKGTSGFQFRANHQTEGKRWIWAITNAIQAAKEQYQKDFEEAGGTLPVESFKQQAESLNSFEDDDEDQESMEEPFKEKYGLTAQSVTLQVEVLEQLLGDYTSDPNLVGALRSVRNTVADFLKMTAEREQYFQARLDRELEVRRLWEDNMQRVEEEQEQMQRIVMSAEREKKEARKALRGAMTPDQGDDIKPLTRRRSSAFHDEESDEEFFDAVEAGEVDVIDAPLARVSSQSADASFAWSFQGYEEPLRTKLSVVDDRPKISLWGILKSMIGKDMTKMTLPVSFNEPTSLLQRAAEDMEYSDLLDIAADTEDATQRLLYVAAFAASEYSSTILRVAKPFNPLLGETFEYSRPDKRYRFFDEQVSHHPPVAAVWAESPLWTYFGESAVKSKFYGKSFEFQFPTPWFLHLRSKYAEEETYTWKKVNTSVVGIITGNPTVDNYGKMEVKNVDTGDVCELDFKQRGWRGSGAFEVSGNVKDADGTIRWTIGGHWNSKLFARKYAGGDEKDVGNPDTALLVWKTNDRPPAPFNLTPFATSLNALPKSLQPYLPPTDTRLRPDQRAMEDAKYDLAATEKNRLEEKQRASRRQREIDGESWEPMWFTRAQHEKTGDRYWKIRNEYWEARQQGDWKGVPDIF